MNGEARALFTPNRALSPNTVRTLVFGQLLFVLILWFFSPFVYLPKPGETVASFIDLWKAGLGAELLTSLGLNIQALALATVISLAFAYSSRLPFMRPIVMLVGKLRFLSMAGLAFLFTLVASTGHELKLYLLAFSITVFFVTTMTDVVANIPQEQYDLAHTLGMNEWRTLLEVVIFGQADQAFIALRSNAAIGWMVITMIEGMARSGGVGTVLLDQNRHFHLAAVFAIQLTILVLGLGQDYLIGWLRIQFCPYADLALERK
jgi:NitT/TauT family transport system permease protein